MELLKPQREHGQMELDLAQLTELYHQNAAGLCQRLSNHICALPEGAAFDEIGKVNLADQMIRRFLLIDRTNAAVHINLWGGGGASPVPSIIEMVDA
jgi:hypothetical protein